MVERKVALAGCERRDSSEAFLREMRRPSHLFAFSLTHSVFRSMLYYYAVATCAVLNEYPARWQEDRPVFVV